MKSVNMIADKILFRKKRPDATLPSRKHEQDAGLDLHSVEEVTLKSGESKVVHTGIELAKCMPDLVLFIWPKSGMDAKYGITTGAGVVDSNYRGEILVLLRNVSDSDYIISKGEQVAQLVPVLQPSFEAAWGKEVSASERGADGGIARSE